MKPALLLGLLLTGPGLAQEAEMRPAPPAFEKGQVADATFLDDSAAPKMVRVTMEFFEVSAPEANRLLHVEKLGKDGAKLRQALQQMLGEGKASEFESISAIGRSWEKASSESIQEVVYPSDVEALLPGSFTQSNRASHLDKVPSSAFPINYSMPTAYEVRNVGSTLEVESTLDAEKGMMDVRLSPEVVLRSANSKSRVIHLLKDKEDFVEMPTFYSLRTKGALTLSDGAPMLFATLTPMAANGTGDRSKKLLVLVTGDVITVQSAKK